MILHPKKDKSIEAKADISSQTRSLVENIIAAIHPCGAAVREH